MTPKEPAFTTRPTIESPALQRRQRIVEAYAQERILDAAARAAAPQPREPQLFPDLAANDADAGPEIPPNPYQAAATIPPPREEARDGGSRGRRFLWIGVGAVSAVAIVLPLLMWLKQDQPPVVADADLPVVPAELGPEKERPADEGGLQPPNQDVAVYDTLNGAAPAPQAKPEMLLPPSEAPMTLPESAPSPAPSPPASEDGADASAIPAVPAPAFDVSGEAAADVAGEAAAAAKVEPSAGGNAAESAAPAAPAASEQPKDITTVVEQTASLGDAYRVQLAAVKSQDGAQETWTKLQKKHAKLLGNLELTVIEITKDGTKLYRVQGGPFADRAKAVDTCVALKQLNQGCLVVNP